MKKLLLVLFVVFKSYVSGVATFGAPISLSTVGVNASNPIVRIDANGNLLALWIENGLIKSVPCPVLGNWTLPAVDLGATGASSLQAAVDRNGNATAVWIQGGVLFASTKLFNSIWSTPAAISSSGVSVPQLSVDTTGNVAAIWVRSGGIETAQLPFGGVWTSPTVLTSGPADSPQISVGGNSVVIAVWHALNGSVNAIYAASTLFGGAWSAPQLISTSTLNCIQPQMKVDPFGNALAIWYSYILTGNVYSSVIVQSAYMPFNNVWGTPVNVSDAGLMNPNLLTLKLRFNAKGIGLAAWTTGFSLGYFTLQGSAFYQGAWAVRPSSVSATDPYIYDFDYSMASPSGYFLGVYMISTPSLGSKINAFMGNSFSAFKNVFINQTISALNVNRNPVAAATFVGGQIILGATWVAYDGQNSIIQACTGIQTIISQPINLTVTQNSNNTGLFTEYYNTLSWQVPVGVFYDGFVVYRNGAVLNTGPNTATQFIDHNVVQGQSVMYGVAFFLSNGDESLITNITYP